MPRMEQFVREVEKQWNIFSTSRKVSFTAGKLVAPSFSICYIEQIFSVYTIEKEHLEIALQKKGITNYSESLDANVNVGFEGFMAPQPSKYTFVLALMLPF